MPGSVRLALIDFNPDTRIYFKVSLMRNIFNITSMIALSVSAAVLAGCGGGSSSPAGTAPSAVANVLAPLQATYLIACTSLDSSDGKLESEHATIIITPDASSNGAEVSMHAQHYVGSANCASGTLDTDLTVKGKLSDKGTSKNFKDAAGNTVVGKVVSFTYTGLTLSKGNLSGSLPTFGTTATVAYVLTGNKLYVSKGHRGADGIGDVLSTEVIVKQ